MIPPILMEIFVTLVLSFSLSLSGKFKPVDDRPAYPTYCAMDTTEPYFLLPFINYLPSFLDLCPPRPIIQIEYSPLITTASDEPLEPIKSSPFVPVSSPATNTPVESSGSPGVYTASTNLPNSPPSAQHHVDMVHELGRRLTQHASTFTHQLVRTIRAAKHSLTCRLQKIRPRFLTIALLALMFCFLYSICEREARLVEQERDLRGWFENPERRIIERLRLEAAERHARGRPATDD